MQGIQSERGFFKVGLSINLGQFIKENSTFVSEVGD